MTLATGSLRKHALQMVREAVASGRATKEDLTRWQKELGDEVAEIAKGYTPPKKAKASSRASSDDKE